MSAIHSRFLRLHEGCIKSATQSDWNLITVVPPSKQRDDPQPLISVLQSIKRIEPIVTPLLETVQKVRHRDASDTAFRVTHDVSGRRILVVDDTFTSGAGIQSAASALSLAGATVVAGLVVGRVIDVQYSPNDLDLWNQMTDQGFTFDTCCVH